MTNFGTDRLGDQTSYNGGDRSGHWATDLGHDYSDDFSSNDSWY